MRLALDRWFTLNLYLKKLSNWLFFSKFLFRLIFVLLTFCSAEVFALTPVVPTTTCLMVLQQFLFHSLFVPHFCSTDLFALTSKVPTTTCLRILQQFLFCSIFVLPFCSTFLFHIFVLLNFLYLPLKSPPPPHVQGFSNNYCSAHFLFHIFVLQTFLQLLLGSLPSHVWVSYNNFYSTMTFLHCPHQVLFRCFCSTFLFCWPFCTCTYNSPGIPIT